MSAVRIYTGGAKLVTLTGPHCKIRAADLAIVLARSGAGVVHHVQPATISLTQARSWAVYSVDEVHDIAEITHAHSLSLHGRCPLRQCRG